jgi:putative heme-binding domain-containing protein
MAKLGRGRMPHFGSQVVDEAGLNLVAEWIEQLGASTTKQVATSSPMGSTPITNARPLLPQALTGPAIEASLASTSSALALLRHLPSKQARDRDTERVVSLGIAHPDPQIRDLFERFVPEEKRIKRLGSAVRPAELLALRGDADRGEKLFFEAAGVTCRNCHRLQGKGTEVGPDLSQIGKKLSKPQLLESILEPSKAVDPKYVAWIVETSQGQVHVGLLKSRSDTEVVLRDAQNKEIRIPADDIEVIAPQRQSLMPELLLRDMTPQEVADLLEFLAAQKAELQAAVEPGIAKPPAENSVTWKIDNLEAIGGHKVTVLGQPRVIDTPQGKAVAFDGVDDGLSVANHPLAGAGKFTAEVVFQPSADGPKEQRFFHLQETGSENRVLFETRLVGQEWFLDTYIKSGAADATLFAEGFKHPIGPWYHAAIVVDGTKMRHYVNGKLELEKELAFQPHQPGETSIGVRHNRVFWYKGAIRTARFTPRVLSPEEFLESKP